MIRLSADSTFALIVVLLLFCGGVFTAICLWFWLCRPLDVMEGVRPGFHARGSGLRGGDPSRVSSSESARGGSSHSRDRRRARRHLRTRRAVAAKRWAERIAMGGTARFK